jgi:hypothetical protein
LDIPAIRVAIDSKILEYIGFAMLVSMVLFGIVTFKRLVKRSEDIDRYQQELMKIRNYFLDKDQAIGKYSSPYSYDKGYSTTQLKDIVCLQDGSRWVTAFGELIPLGEPFHIPHQ